MTDTSIRDQLVRWYGDGSSGAVPRPEQWDNVLNRNPDDSFTLINLFKLREVASYNGEENEISGQEAFDRYAAVSMPTMERVGGKFLLVAPFEASLIGNDDNWDLIAIGTYPSLQAFLDLYQDANYRAAFEHRTAACSAQKVLIAGT